jgi:hypothetical protein
MDEKSNRHANYVGRLQEDTQRMVKELMGENERLRRIATSLERDNTLLLSQVKSLNEELERQKADQTSLHHQLEEIERESRRYAEQFAEIEQRSANLANLYVSSYQLHGTLDREAVLTAIKEILINLVGSEELAVFEVIEDGSALKLVTSFGIDESAYARVGMREHPIGSLIATGDTFLADTGSGASSAVRVCVPLKLDGRITGAIVLFSLLPHKPQLQELDFELFDLLGTHAATALYCTGLHTRVTAATAMA